MYRDTPEDPNLPEESGGGNSKEEIGSIGCWSDQGETVDEELPLAFSDMVVVRFFFSRKANKILKKR